jgi:hypothetical protein
MSFASATKFNRKSGEAEESAVFASPYRMLTGETVLFIPSAAEGTPSGAFLTYAARSFSTSEPRTHPTPKQSNSGWPLR